MDFDKVVKRRTSIRDYALTGLKIEKVIDLIEAANLAPSPGNLPILKYIIVEEQEKIDTIAKACRQEFIREAPFVVVVCSNPKKAEIMYDKRAKTYIKHHTGAAVENFLLKATDLGLASCWVGAFSEITIKHALNIPDEIDVEVILPVAHHAPRYKGKQKPKFPLDKIIYFEDYGNRFKKGFVQIGQD